MAFDLSFGSLASARDRLTRMRDDGDPMPPDAISRAAKNGIRMAETVGSAAAFAWLQAKFDKSNPNLITPMGIPVDLLAGAGLGIAAIGLPLVGVDIGGYADHMTAVATGALSVYAAKMAVDHGAKSAVVDATNKISASAAAKGLVAGAPAFVAHAHGAPVGRRTW